MVQSIKKYLSWLLYVLLCTCFTSVVLHILIQNSAYNYKRILLIPLILLSLGIIVFAYFQFKKYEEPLEKSYKIVVIVLLVIMAILQIIFGNMLRFTPAYDLGAVYGGAVQWVQDGTVSNFEEYFSYFPVNLGGTTFLFFFFKIADIIGFRDFFMVAVILNSMLSISTMLVTASICKKILGTRYAYCSLLFFLITLPFYFIAASFYTDTMSILFPVLFYYLYLLVKDAKKRSKQLLLYVLMGLVAGIGMQIKFTVLIMVIAVLIDSLFHCKIKKTLLITGITGALIILIFTTVNSSVTDKFIDKEKREQNSTPILHLVMMGLNGTGFYNPDDFNFTRSFTDPVEQNKAIIEEIKKRMKERGVNGMLELFSIKSQYCFGDGTFGLSDFLDDTPTNRTIVHEYVLYDGRHYEIYANVCEAVFFAILVLMIFSALQEILSKEMKFRMFLAPRTAILGLFMFLCMWETARRHCTNFLPIIFISGIMGIDYYIEQMKNIYKNMKRALHL